MTSISPTDDGQRKIMGLEGMKGLLIMYVMVHHLSKMTSVPWITAAMHHGSVGVDPFFVLSGFVLMRWDLYT